MMNIIETIKVATELAKKGMMVELQEKIAQLREEVIALKEDNIQLRTSNLELKEQIDKYSKDAICPKCKKTSWHLEGSKPHPMFGDAGVIERTYICSECGHSEKHLFDPK